MSNETRTINGLRTVNGGIIEEINGLKVEILSHNFHNPHCNIICTYYLDESDIKRGAKTGFKVQLTYYKDIFSGQEGHEVYLFYKPEDLQHYRSYNYYGKKKLPAKYQDLANRLIEIHNQIDFDKYKTRPKY